MQLDGASLRGLRETDRPVSPAWPRGSCSSSPTLIKPDYTRLGRRAGTLLSPPDQDYSRAAGAGEPSHTVGKHLTPLS